MIQESARPLYKAQGLYIDKYSDKDNKNIDDYSNKDNNKLIR